MSTKIYRGRYSGETKTESEIWESFDKLNALPEVVDKKDWLRPHAKGDVYSFIADSVAAKYQAEGWVPMVRPSSLSGAEAIGFGKLKDTL